MKFRKMHGLGNDFVIIDERKARVALSAERVQLMGNRHFGVGFDQLVTIENDETADAKLVFWNHDGSISGACGNATRCCADIIMKETGKSEITLHTERGYLACHRHKNGQITVNMGDPIRDWRRIPLIKEMDIYALPIEGAPSAMGMGNPHCVFFVDDAEAVDLAHEGAKIEHHALFPERTNVEYLSPLGKNRWRMRVWERGGMITNACGSGACAAAVVAFDRGLSDAKQELVLDGGVLAIEITDSGVLMTGDVAYVFSGEFDAQFLSN